MYETRYTKLTELRTVSKYMRSHQCGVLTTSVSVIAFNRHGGKILVTLNERREIVGVFAYVVMEAPDTFSWDKHLLVQAAVVNDKLCADITDSMRLAIYAVLSTQQAKYATTYPMSSSRECEGLMLALGFLPEDVGSGSLTYTCRASDNHMGAVILERILNGHCETLVEV